MKHTEVHNFDGNGYVGAQCSCGWIRCTGSWHHDHTALIEHMKSAEAKDDKDTVVMLLERLAERTQGMLAKQAEMIAEIRRLNRILEIKERSKQNPYAGL